MKKVKTFFYSISPLLVIVGIFAILELAVQLFDIPNYVLPSPIESFRFIFTSFTTEMWPHVSKTIVQYLVGYPIGSLIGIVLALLFTMSKTISKAIDPYLTVIFCCPMLVLVPLLKVWLGYGASVCTIVCALSCFSSTMTQIMTGAKMIPYERFELVQSCKGNKLQLFFHIIIPSCWSSIFTGLKLGAISGLAGTIGAEMIGDTMGIGYVVKLNTSIYLITEMFAYVYVLMVFGYIVYSVICALEDKLIKE